MKHLERDVQKAVDEVLNTNEWPIYKTEDDRGLEQSEYYEFAVAVVRKVLASSTDPNPHSAH